MMESIWRKNVTFPKKETLKEDKNTDVVVIGAGLAGLLTAYLLHQEGINTIVLEANKIASGQTMNTTAKITSQHNLIYDQLIHDFGIEKAVQYAEANERAITIYDNIIRENNISCHFKRESSYVYTLRDVSKIEKEVESANKLGIKAEFTTNTSLPMKIKASIKFPNQASFHPLEFLQEIIKPLAIYEHTMVREVKDQRVITDYSVIKAKHIVVATHYPFINTPGYYFARMHQERSYVLGLANVPQLDGMYIDENNNGFSFRNYEDFLLFGGPGHRTGKNKYGGYYEKIRRAALEFYPDSKEICHWSAQDCVTIDNVPYIGAYSSSTPNVYVATGFKKWGMTTSMVSAMILRDKILGNKNPYEEVYNPQRFKITASVKNLYKDGKETTTALAREYFKSPKIKLEETESGMLCESSLSSIKNGHGGIVEHDGKKYGIYKDETGKIYAVSTKCTHLGCQLEWNQDELSWDCPCHGSRFDYSGNLINNPAMKDLNNIKMSKK